MIFFFKEKNVLWKLVSKRLVTNWEKILESDISNKGIISRIYEEPSEPTVR